MEAVIVAALIGLAVAGVLIGPSALLLPVAVIPVVYVGADKGWWGNGLGDGWYAAMLLVLAIAFGATAAGVAARRLRA
jgi:hypothetical protein